MAAAQPIRDVATARAAPPPTLYARHPNRDAADRVRRWVVRRSPVLLGALAWLCAIPAVASPPADPHALCIDAIRSAEARHATPPGLLSAIARVESGRAAPPTGAVQPWPWTVNIGGAGQFFATRETAVAAIRQALAVNAGYTDVGCMQVNLQFHPKAFRSLDDAFDPTTNVDYAARFLVSLRDAAGGNWFVAVGLYHSRSPDLAHLYRARVSLAGTVIRPLGAGRMKIVLPNGRVMTINVNRQPGRARKHRSACEVAAILGSYMAVSARREACAQTTPAANPG